MATIAVRVKSGADSKHDGKLVESWTPHTRAGILGLTSTDDPARALTFDTVEDAMIVWNTVSNVQPLRPWDRRPNKPLTRVAVELVDLE